MEIFRPMCKAMLLPPLLILEPPGNADLLTQNEALVGLTSTEILYEESGSSYPLCAISMVFFVCVLFFFLSIYLLWLHQVLVVPYGLVALRHVES